MINAFLSYCKYSVNTMGRKRHLATFTLSSKVLADLSSLSKSSGIPKSRILEQSFKRQRKFMEDPEW